MSDIDMLYSSFPKGRATEEEIERYKQTLWRIYLSAREQALIARLPQEDCIRKQAENMANISYNT